MKVSLVDVDGTGFPNLALMKISAWHKEHGDTVDWYSPMFSHPERIYASKIFTFSPDFIDYYVGDPEPIKGGTGYDMTKKLYPEVDSMLPDYSIYPSVDYAIGFLSRGCIRKCKWCVVPKKEGELRKYSSLETVSKCYDGQTRKNVVLMDNNFLGNDMDFIVEQVEISLHLKLRLDFNQGLDARLVNDEIARQLVRIHWMNYIRFSCDTQSSIEPVIRAMRILRAHGYRKEFFIYFLAIDAEETHERIKEVMLGCDKVTPYVMPYRDFSKDGNIVNEETKHLARWANRVWIRKSTTFENYRRRAHA